MQQVIDTDSDVFLSVFDIYAETEMAPWLGEIRHPSLVLLYGLGQGFVEMWITEVPPARFCLYFACARAVVMVCYFFASPHAPLFAADGRHVLAIGVLAYLFDGAGWIMYFQSIIAGPIPIVGTLSDAYPALTIVFAHWFLGETLSPLQYGAVVLVIGGCIGLACQPAGTANKVTGRAWIPLAFSALVSKLKDVPGISPRVLRLWTLYAETQLKSENWQCPKSGR